MRLTVQLAQWLHGPLAERLKRANTGPPLAESGYFNPERLRSMLEKHQSGQRNFSAPRWSLLMFDAFLKNAEKIS